MKCPKCGLINPDSAIRCDCGYDFPSGEIKESYVQSGGTLFRTRTQREYASVLTRFGAILIDSLLVLLFYLPLFVTSSILENQTGGLAAVVGRLPVLSFVGAAIFGLWNNIFRMGNTGQSLGRKFLNIAVLDDHGAPIGAGRAFLREVIGRWISGLICYLGYLWAFWDDEKQMWHDKMANCFVYYVEEDFS